MQQKFSTVADVMQTDLCRIDGLASISEALAEMRKRGVTSLIIDRRHPGDEHGFLTLNEIASRVIAVNKSMERTSVYEIMDKPILTLAPSMNVKYAVRLLVQLGRRRALVQGGDSGLLGYVSLRDLVLSYADAEAAAAAAQSSETET